MKLDWDYLLDEFLRLKGGSKGCDTYKSYQRTSLSFQTHVQTLYDGMIPFSQLTPDDVSSFVMAEINTKRSKDREKRIQATRDNKRSAPPSPLTINNRLAILAGLFDVAIYYDKSITNHAKNLRAILGRKLKESGQKKDHGVSQRKKALNKKERHAFYEAINLISFSKPAWKEGSGRYKAHMTMKPAIIARNQTMFYLFEATGVRVSGMTMLDIYALNLDRMELTVTEKGGKSRITPILPNSITDDAMQQHLIDWIEIFRPQIMGNKTHACLWVNNRGEPMKNWFIQDLCRKAMQYADLHKPYFGPHLLRHTFATDKLDSGNSPRDVAMVMGHADLQSISTYDSGEAEAARERMRKNSWGK